MVHRALIVGISDYGREDWYLPGCDRDAADWKALLLDVYGFRNENIRVLRDKEANKGRVVEELKHLFSSAAPGDRLVFVYAGHGTAIPAAADDAGEEKDGLDECLVLYPTRTADPHDYLLSDNELRKLIQQCAPEEGKDVTVLCDSCHSGGMKRAFGEQPNSNAPLPRSVVIKELQPKVSRGTTPKVKPRDQDTAYVVVAAAAENESAWDCTMDDGLRHGAFTYFATRLLREENHLDLLTLKNRCSEKIERKKLEQHPDILGGGARQSQNFLGGGATKAHAPSTSDSSPGPSDAEDSVDNGKALVHGFYLSANDEQRPRFAVEGPWNLKDPVHESITQRALQRARLLPGNEQYTATRGWEFIRGAIWNDDPEALLFDNNENETANWSTGAMFLSKFTEYKKRARKGEKFAQGAPIFARSHFGDLQCLHSMAAADGETPQDTRENILAMAEFLYAVAKGDIGADVLVGSTGLPKISHWFPNDKRSVKNFFRIWNMGNTRMRAMGALMHLIQDSYCDAHVERGHVTKSDDSDAQWYIREFHSYISQDDTLHGKGDAMQSGGIDAMPGALRAVKVCANVLEFWKSCRPWSELRAYLVENVYVLAPDVRAAGPGTKYAMGRRSTPSTVVGQSATVNFTITGVFFREEKEPTPLSGKDLLWGEPFDLTPNGTPVSFSYEEKLPDTELRVTPVFRMNEHQDVEVTLIMSLHEGPEGDHVEVKHATLGPFVVNHGTSSAVITGYRFQSERGANAQLNVSVGNAVV